MLKPKPFRKQNVPYDSYLADEASAIRKSANKLEGMPVVRRPKFVTAL